MPTDIRQNLPENVISILNLVKRYRREASENPNFNTPEALEDLETHLCDLLSSLISSPLTGRIFLQPPAAYTSEKVASDSLHANLVLD